MTQQLSYERLLETSQRVNWRLEDIIGNGQKMDFSKPFLPESFARTKTLSFLSSREKLLLNQIRAFGYLAMFELVERCILPFIDDHVPAEPGQDAYRSQALAQFSAEEAKHIELFVRFRQEFVEGFQVECGFIGPAEEIGAAIRSHSPVGVAIFVLAIEWATQRHYLESVRDDEALDPQFKSLLKNHWIEESQHAKLDALVFYEMAATSSAEQIEAAVDDFLDIGGFIDAGLKQQVAFDLKSLEVAMGRTLPNGDRQQFLEIQHQAMRWTFLGTALRNDGFLEAVGSVSRNGRTRIEQIAPAFC